MKDEITFYDREKPDESPEIKNGEIKYIKDTRAGKYVLVDNKETNIIEYYKLEK